MKCTESQTLHPHWDHPSHPSHSSQPQSRPAYLRHRMSQHRPGHCLHCRRPLTDCNIHPIGAISIVCTHCEAQWRAWCRSEARAARHREFLITLATTTAIILTSYALGELLWRLFR